MGLKFSTYFNFIFYAILLNLFLFGSCHQEDGFELPPITQTGENTFGCYFDGKLFVPRDGKGTFNVSDRGMRYLVDEITSDITYNEIKVRDFRSGNGGLLDLYVAGLDEKGEGTFTINESNCEDGIDANSNINIRCRWWDEEFQEFKWYCSIENGGIITISRYDLENSIISGTFSCTVKNRDNSNDIIKITEGRFDINWKNLRYTSFQ